MIVSDPSDTVLKSADIVALFDPQQPRWYKVVVDLQPGRPRSPTGYIVIDIPVDSTNAAAVQAWRYKIAAARDE